MQQRPDVLLLSLKGTELQKQSPYILTATANGSDEKTTYYVLLESVNPDDDKICGVAAQVLKALLLASRGSLTASLSAVIKEAHQRLYHFNQQRPTNQRAGIGVTCLALKGNDVFVGAAGPSFAYLLDNGKIRQVTNPSEGGISALVGIGMGSKAEVQLFYHTLEPGNVIFLATSSLRRALSERGLQALLGQDGESYQDNLKQLGKNLPYLSTIRLDLREKPLRKPQNGKRAVVQESAAVLTQTVSKVRLPKIPHKVGPPIAGNGRAVRQKSTLVKLHDAMQHLLPIHETQANQIPDSQAKKVKPGPPGNSLEAEASPTLRKLRLPLLAVAVFLALLIGVQMLLLYPSYANKQSAASVNSLLSQSQAAYDTAMTKDDKASRRQLLLEADKLASDALAIKKDDARAISMHQSITSDLNILDAVVTLSNLRQLEDYSKIGTGSSNITKVILNNNSFYVLDRGAERVYSSTLNSSGSAVVGDSTKILLKKGDRYDGINVGSPIAMTWTPQGGSRSDENLMVLDDRYSLFQFTSGKGWSSLRLRGTDAWSSFKGFLGYNGNLYTLDPRANQVWRYIPTASGYDSERRGILQNGDIPDSIDLAIDSDVYILNSTGLLWKFSDGNQQKLSQSGIDKPMSNPSSLYTSDSTRYIYVVDTGNRRIVVFTKSGLFYRQYVNEAFNNLRSIYVDEEKAKIYILDDRKLYVANLPR